MEEKTHFRAARKWERERGRRKGKGKTLPDNLRETLFI